MDTKIKKFCPSCNQCYFLKALGSNTKSNIPLFLSCGHTMCENCVSNIVKFAEPIECKVCHQDMQVDTNDLALLMKNKISLYNLFPVNIFMVGELTLETIEERKKKVNTDEYYIDTKGILQNNNSAQGECVECRAPTHKMCKQCGIIVCDNCFNKSHKNFVIFRNHILRNIEGNIQKNNCMLHQEKQLDYYCKNCMKAICMDCFMVGGKKSCKNHDVVPIQEVNEEFLTELTNITPKVDEVLRRLSRTAVDIGHLLTKLNDESNSTEYTTTISNIEQHFSKLTLIMQNKKYETINKVLQLKFSEQDSLIKAKHVISDALKKTNNTLNTINSLDPKKLKEINMPAILEEARQITKIPWYLHRSDSERTLNLTFNEEILSSIENYIQLEGKETSKYELLTSEMLNENNEVIPVAPVSIVYPPKITRDVRQLPNQTQPKTDKDNSKTATFLTKVPTYRSKSGSSTSLNSIKSDTSYKSYQSYDQKSKVDAATAYTDSQLMQPFLEGSQELIYVSHIVDPHQLFVQRASLQGRVEELLREFRNAVSLPQPSLAHVAEGKFYLVFNKADNLWQRCRVMSIDRRDVNKPIFHVFCIDFGCTEVVSIDKLRLIPPARIAFPPPFAVCCSLANCEPINGSWTSDDSFFIQNIIDNKQAVLHVRRVLAAAGGAAGGAARVQADVSTFEHGVSLAHALAFHGRARLPDKLPYPKIKGITEKPKIFINNKNFQNNAVEEVYITHVVSPDNFFVRKRHLQSVFEKLCEDLEEEYSLSVNTGSIYLPEKDMVCVAHVEQCGVRGGAWARAVVRELPGRVRVRALLPDVGATVLLHWTALRRILPKFTVLRALATECHLAGVTPLNKKWSPASVALLQKFEDRLLDLHVEESRNRSSLGVTLYDKSDEENIVCINTQMIKNKFAVTFGLYKFNKNTETDELVFTNKCPLDEPKLKPELIKKDTGTTLKIQPTKPNEEDLDAKDKGPLRLEVKILNYQSPSLIYVSLVHQQKIFTELFDNIQKYYTKKKTQEKRDWKIEDRCCTVCSQSQTWRRAAILEIVDANAKVFYSDFAYVETVPISSLREIPQEFASIGDAAVMCHLCGVVPAVGEEWPSLTKEYLKELLEAYKRVFITKLGKFKGKSMPVELWVYHTIQGGALEANTSEWRCLNKKIIDQGLGIPDKSQELSDSDKTSKNTADDMLSFLNITGSVHDWLQIEPMPLKPLQINPESDSNSSTPIDDDALNTEADNHNSNTVFISDWLPPEPLPSNEITAMPTYIDNDGIIYLHDIAQQDTLDLIRKALDVRFNNPDPKAKYVKWTVGEPCIALFFLDNRFYRGRVLEVNDEASSCLIHYVDYGNEEVCSFKNLRKSVVLHQIPIQAHKCVLNRIRPAGNWWDRQSLDYIHKSIVEKQCYVKVSGEPIGDLIPIELKYDKLWINDHLVDFEMAVYTDGSKAVVRKFAPPAKESKKLETSIETDSGPDNIVEYEDLETQSTDSQTSANLNTIEGKDWNSIMAEDGKQFINRNFMSYLPYKQTEFTCNITVLNEINKLELSVIHDDETTKAYDEMFKELQSESSKMTALNGIFENKACLALFPDDGQWYRAIILQYSEAKNRIKVKYVDYGNIEIISLADVREISKKYTKLPPATITVTLHGVRINPDLENKILYEYLIDTFMEKGPFKATLIDTTDVIPTVELRNDNGQLVYKKLIQENVYLKCD
ncbi:RING finger protein 17 [Nymphalis io]|uniref:RING finger protein 17 n=1 Tax=Inachis io TaxID=171585 RepID=UPI002169BAEF|nr:RING finger protein 17 [Nymphalis io]XP_050349475.1 RING finger protein 17 [Nymphalis io]